MDPVLAQDRTHPGALASELSSLVGDVLDRLPAKDLEAAYRALSARYGDGGATPNEALTGADVAAYAMARMPATLSAVAAVFDQVKAARAAWNPCSLLDVGAGLGTAAWAAVRAFPTVKSVTLVERAERFVQAGKRLAERSKDPALQSATWITGDLRVLPPGDYDLVIASYVLGELERDARATAIESWFGRCSGELILIEPGTPTGFANILDARNVLLAAGAELTAPCPHAMACPITASDWCHFSARLPRTKLHAELKGGVRGFEDEKFSYVVGSVRRAPGIAGRVVRHPLQRSGHTRLAVCAPDGVLREEVISRRDGERYKRARKVAWGDALPTTLNDAFGGGK